MLSRLRLSFFCSFWTWDEVGVFVFFPLAIEVQGSKLVSLFSRLSGHFFRMAFSCMLGRSCAAFASKVQGRLDKCYVPFCYPNHWRVYAGAGHVTECHQGFYIFFTCIWFINISLCFKVKKRLGLLFYCSKPWIPKISYIISDRSESNRGRNIGWLRATKGDWL